MNLRLSEKIKVIALFDRSDNHLKPVRLQWRNRPYAITEISFHHREKRGRILFHIFSCVTDTLFFRISFDTENLDWLLEEVSDGLVD